LEATLRQNWKGGVKSKIRLTVKIQGLICQDGELRSWAKTQHLWGVVKLLVINLKPYCSLFILTWSFIFLLFAIALHKIIKITLQFFSKISLFYFSFFYNKRIQLLPLQVAKLHQKSPGLVPNCLIHLARKVLWLYVIPIYTCLHPFDRQMFL
jgi:hypothetical protein